jgi:hypothetical protein
MTVSFLALYSNQQGGQCLSHVGTEGDAQALSVLLDARRARDRKARVMLIWCCDACSSCAIGSDDFSTNDLATAWTTTGTMVISGGVLLSFGASMTIFNTAHPDGVSTMSVSVDFSHGSGHYGGVVVGYVDANNYCYVRFTAGSNLIDIRQVVAGVDSSVGSKTVTISAGTTYTAFVCVNGHGAISASLDGTVVISETPGVTLGTKCGLKTDSAGATFDNFVAAKSFAASGASSCAVCSTTIPIPATCQDCCSDVGDLIFNWPGGFGDINCTLCSSFTAGDYTLTPITGFGCNFTFCGGTNEPTCTDGLPESSDSTAGDPCWIFITAQSSLDTTQSPPLCMLKVGVQLWVRNSGTVEHLLVDLTYMTAASGGPFDFCDGTTFTLIQHSEASPGTSYRGATDWASGYTAGCTGSAPSSPTIRRA